MSTKKSSTKTNDIPESSLTSAVTTDLPEATTGPTEPSYKDPYADAGLGLVKVDGIDLKYVGVAPARDKKAETPDGYPITPTNSTFTPLSNVPFDRSLKVKDPKTGEFYFPADGCTSWDGCELNGSYLVPRG